MAIGHAHSYATGLCSCITNPDKWQVVEFQGGITGKVRFLENAKCL